MFCGGNLDQKRPIEIALQISVRSHFPLVRFISSYRAYFPASGFFAVVVLLLERMKPDRAFIRSACFLFIRPGTSPRRDPPLVFHWV